MKIFETIVPLKIIRVTRNRGNEPRPSIVESPDNISYLNCIGGARNVNKRESLYSGNSRLNVKRNRVIKMYALEFRV